MLDTLFDPQTIIFAGLTTTVILLTLIVLAVVSRRLRLVASDVESLRRDVTLVNEALDSVSLSLQQRGKTQEDKERELDQALKSSSE